MPDVNKEKYKNVILFLCNQLGGSIDGKKKLYKLLYYIDFDRFEYKESMKSVTGESYRAIEMGPAPIHFDSVVEELKSDGALTVKEEQQYPNYKATQVYQCAEKPNMMVFDEDDVAIMNRVVKQYGGLTGKQLQLLSHNEAPYLGTEPSSEIPYELAFYRETDFSDTVSGT